MGGELREFLHRGFLDSGGRSAVVAARRDQRCSYCLYVGRTPRRRNLLAYCHGHHRRHYYLLNALRQLADACGYVVLCPLFPGNLLRDGNLDGYKYLREEGVNYDEIFMDIVDEVREAINFEETRILLGGFSGGGQFAHRFAYLHPDFIQALSIAAPGTVTLPDPTIPWWAGLGAAENVFGLEIDADRLKAIDIQLVVGAADDDAEDARFSPSSRYWLPEASLTGSTRVERLQALHQALEARGVAARLDVVPGAGHHFASLLPVIEDFFRRYAVHSLNAAPS